MQERGVVFCRHSSPTSNMEDSLPPFLYTSMSTNVQTPVVLLKCQLWQHVIPILQYCNHMLPSPSTPQLLGLSLRHRSEANRAHSSKAILIHFFPV